MEEPIHDLCDFGLFLGLFRRDILKAPQVLIEVDLVDADAPVEVLAGVGELENQVVVRLLLTLTHHHFMRLCGLLMLAMLRLGDVIILL